MYGSLGKNIQKESFHLEFTIKKGQKEACRQQKEFNVAMQYERLILY